LSGLAAELLRTGRAAARAAGGRVEPVLRSVPAPDARAHGHPGDGGHRRGSQALISGAFSLTGQAVQLGYLPRVTIVHTSGKAEGQIYVPEVNAALMAACVALVRGFRSSSNLASAYGIAVTGTMSITTILFFFLARDRWGWSLAKAG